MKNILKKFMLTAFICCITTISSSTADITEKNKVEKVQILPITEYENSLYAMLSKFIAEYLYNKPETKKIGIKLKKKQVKSSREKAIEEITKTSTKLFDRNDPHHISVHLNTMKDLAQDLDPHLDKKTINAIHFLLENQHRSSIILDTLFWKKAIKEHELDTAIPTTPEVANMSAGDKLMILNKKMKLARPEPELELELMPV